MPIIEVQIEDITCRALIDTGSTMNLMSINILNKLKKCIFVDAPTVEVRTITNATMHSGCVINSKILIDKFEYEDDFVVPHSNLSPVFDIILGLNFLNKNEFIIDCKNNSLRNETTSINWNFKRSYYNVFGHIDGKINDKCREKLNTSVQNEINRSQMKLIGKSVSKVRIPPNSQRYVDISIQPTNVTLQVGQPLLIEKYVNSHSSSFLVARAVSNMNTNNRCLALILNLNDSTLVLNKGMALVSIVPIEQVAVMQNINSISVNNSQNEINWENSINLSHLNHSERSDVISLLNKYNSVFAQELSDLGECSIIQHEIHLTDNIPTRQKPYRVPYNLKAEMKKQINILLDAGIIQPSTSSYAAPVLLVKKSDGSFRLVADLRKLNSKTIPDNFPLPNLNEMIDMLSGSKFFSTLDLTSGFHQMQMNPSHAHLTGITTEFGLFQYKRLPFGLKNAGASFQRLMSIVLAGLSDLKIACYIDDIIIASKTFEEHMNRLEIVFKRLQSANLKVKPSKCSFLQHEITYLGHTVREGQVLPDGKNLDSIRKSLPPTNRKQNHLVSVPCLSLPDFDKPFAICTDASKYSLGAVLVQEDESGFQHPISFASRKLGPTEIKYSVVEKEALGVVFGINHFKNYLYGSHFIVYCDQQCLSKLMKLKDPTSRIARWLLTLQQYTYTVVHKPGRLNLMADYLSRAKYSNNNENENRLNAVNALDSNFSTFQINSMQINDIIKLQNQDGFASKLKKS
ncbi:retrovirus-related Pol polyprotein from transposon 17.6 [Caerostris darwini]|uniref:RNA-directed DNA polymerase n=1 Tax=Caerostris darwini TaxID=1538125 RepID=A0AAV4VZP0_9ARAC|nr:retrovirus-related Pol polyprotein from transposon 17.6 [Caerostris darwini]